MASGKQRVKCITSDPRWRGLAVQYRKDFVSAIIHLFGMLPPISKKK